MALQLPRTQEQTYLIETEDGDLVSVPEGKLQSWQEKQRNGGLSPSRTKQLADKLMQMIYDSKQ